MSDETTRPDQTGEVEYGGGIQPGGGMVEPDEFDESVDVDEPKGTVTEPTPTEHAIGAEDMTSSTAEKAVRAGEELGPEHVPNDALAEGLHREPAPDR